MRKIFALVLALAMVFSCLGVSAMTWEDLAGAFENGGDVTLENNIIHVTVATPEALQEALDTYDKSTTIQLVEDVDYGVVYLRPNPSNPATSEVDWIGNNYGYETYTIFDELIIKGAEGATIDAIVTEGGTYYYSAHSQSTTYPVMLSLVELKDVVFDGVTFTGNGGFDPQGHGNAVNVSEQNIKVNGLTFKNCVLEDASDNNRLFYKTGLTTNVHSYELDGETFTLSPTLANITFEGCTFNGGYMGFESRETENLIVKDCTFNGVASRDMLITNNDGCLYSGEITIIGNTSDGAGDRFIRGTGIGEALLTIKDNTIVNYAGGSDDFIKVEGIGDTYVIEGNTIEGATPDETFANGTYKALKPADDGLIDDFASFKAALAAGGEVQLAGDIVMEEAVVVNGEVVLDLNGFTLSYNSTTMGEAMITNKGNLTINDSVGTGVINYNYTGANDASYGKGNYTISNGGTLTVNGGKITIANLSSHAKYPIDNNNTTGDAIVVINGGHLYNYNTSAIRMMCNSTTYKNCVTVNGGLVEGYCAIWIQNPGKNTVHGKLVVNGGEIKSTAKAYVNGTSELKDVSSAIYCTIAGEGGAWSADSAVALNGGIFNENVNLVDNAPADITFGKDAIFNGRADGASLWATATDAGFYMDGGNKFGLMRFLFAANIEGVTASGIKYVKSDLTTQAGEIVEGGSAAFYGDITEIPESAEGTYYAVAFVTTAEGTIWSAPLACTINWNKEFTNYGGAE